MFIEYNIRTQKFYDCKTKSWMWHYFGIFRQYVMISFYQKINCAAVNKNNSWFVNLISFPSSVGSWKNSLACIYYSFCTIHCRQPKLQKYLLWASEGLIYSSINSQKSCLHLQFCTIFYRRQKLQKTFYRKKCYYFWPVSICYFESLFKNKDTKRHFHIPLNKHGHFLPNCFHGCSAHIIMMAVLSPTNRIGVHSFNNLITCKMFVT